MARYAVVQVADALAKGGIKIVPDIVAGGSDGLGGGLVSVLLGNLLHQDLEGARTPPSAAPSARDK